MDGCSGSVQYLAFKKFNLIGQMFHIAKASRQASASDQKAVGSLRKGRFQSIHSAAACVRLLWVDERR